MSTERWRILSDWHNAWLAAPAGARDQLRASLAVDHPDLLRAWPTTSPPPVVRPRAFSKLRRLVLAARDLAHEESSLSGRHLDRTVPDRGAAGSRRHGRRLPSERPTTRSRRRSSRRSPTPSAAMRSRSSGSFRKRASPRRWTTPTSSKYSMSGCRTAGRTSYRSFSTAKPCERPSGSGPASEEDARRIACAVTERPGGGARTRTRPSRSQAGEHLRHENGYRQDPGLRHREARAGSRAAARRRDTDGQ